MALDVARPEAVIPGGFACDLRAAGGRLWLAWAACADPETDLLAALDGTWPLKPGVTLDDWRAAIAYARGREQVDPDAIALWGTSTSGGHVVQLAAEDPHVLPQQPAHQ